MPTGYTYPVVEGKVTEFRDFALGCARAFGALIMMRDDAADAPIPESIPADTDYYDKCIAAEAQRIEEIKAMSAADADVEARTAYEEAMGSRTVYLSIKELEAERLNAMLQKVRAWQPPTPDHLGMKEFMIDQLSISMPDDYVPAIPVLLDGATWRAQQLNELSAALDRHARDRDKEIERAKGRNDWLAKLRQSLAA